MMIARTKNSDHVKEENHMTEHITEHAVHRPKHHIPPHERKGMISLQFDERDWNIFNEVFGDEDTARAAVDIVHGAPPEIQILVAQVLEMIEKEVA